MSLSELPQELESAQFDKADKASDILEAVNNLQLMKRESKSDIEQGKLGRRWRRRVE